MFLIKIYDLSFNATRYVQNGGYYCVAVFLTMFSGEFFLSFLYVPRLPQLKVIKASEQARKVPEGSPNFTVQSEKARVLHKLSRVNCHVIRTRNVT